MLLMTTGPAFAQSATTVNGVLSSVLSNIDGPLRILLGTICYISGLVLIFRGLIRIPRHSSREGGYLSVPGTIMCFFIGAVMMTMPSQLNIFAQSLFGTDAYSYSALGYDTGENEAGKAAIEVITNVLRFIQIFGLIWFISGWFNLLAASENKHGKTIKGSIFKLLAATACINIFHVIEITQNTLGMSIFEVT